MSSIMQDITKNFVERINRLEVLFAADPEIVPCSVVTFDQSIVLRGDRWTELAEGFDQIEYVVRIDHRATDDDEPTYADNIVGYLSSRSHVQQALPAG
jgi:hypothetical protein